MHLGIFARTFPRPTFEETLDAIADRGLTHVQFNMSCAGMPTLPERVDEDHCVWIARSFRERGLTMAAISGTFNLCDPDPIRMLDHLRRLEILAAACRWLDTRIITLCTGTRDPEDMWKWHAENVRRSTWDALVGLMRQAVKIADRHEVILAFEPERNNVVNSVARARMLLDEVASPWLKVVIDPANLMRADEFSRMEEVLDEAFDWLGPDIVLAHAKNPATGHPPEEMVSIQEYLERNKGRMPLLSLVTDRLEAGGGPPQPGGEIPRSLVDLEEFYFHYIRRLNAVEFDGSVVMHGMPEDRVDPVREILTFLIGGRRNPT